MHHGRARYGEALSGSALVVEFMKLVGADVIFGIPGGASLPLNDAFTAGHEAGAFRYVLTGHEQGAAFEAAGYAGASGRVGFCTATSGPGATNLITGLADAFRDSRPVLAFTGNTATTAEPEAFQAIDIVGITAGKATKASFRPQRPEEVQPCWSRPTTPPSPGAPAPSCSTCPRTCRSGPGRHAPLGGAHRPTTTGRAPAADAGLVAAAARLLAGAQRPLLYVGHGAVLAGAARRAAPRSAGCWTPRWPPPSTASASSPPDDPLNLGMIGHARGDGGQHRRRTWRTSSSPSAPASTTGSSAPRPETFAPNARIVHVDVDARQLNRVRQVDVAIHGDVREVTRAAAGATRRDGSPRAGIDRAPWLAQPGGGAPGHADPELRRSPGGRPSATSSSTASCARALRDGRARGTSSPPSTSGRTR